MTKDDILNEIRRTARQNGGAALGFQRFSDATGIKKSDWYPKHWLRWGDALREAGHQPNQFTAAIREGQLLACLAALMSELGNFPLWGEIRQKQQSDPAFPSHTTFRRLGNKQRRVEKLRAFLLAEGDSDMAALCAPNDAVADHLTAGSDPSSGVVVGCVYLMKAGKYYKIGHTTSLGRRAYELAIQLPEKLALVHSINTDDPVGIEAYWHRRFRDRHKNGEWYALTAQDVTAFKRRKFM